MVLLSGCSNRTSLPQTQAGDPAQPMDFQLLTDIPIPSGATMDDERSLILGDRDRWTGRVVIKLWKNPAQATQFYQQQMPAFGWEPIMAATSGVSVMAYVRGERAATVQIESSPMWGATVFVTVGQRAQTTGTTMPTGNGGGYDSSPERVQSAPLSAPKR